jgi:hypothetical protein
MSMLVLLGAAGVVVTAGASTESAYVHLISPSGGGGGSAADDRAAMLCVSSISGPVGRSYASHSKLYDVCCMISSAGVLCVQEMNVSWSCSGYPLFGTGDGSSRDDGGGRGVRGVDVVCLKGSSLLAGEKRATSRNHRRTDRTPMVRSEEEEASSDDDGDEEGEAGLEDEASLLLFQQSLLGDVHCQRLLLLPRGSSRRAPQQHK